MTSSRFANKIRKYAVLSFLLPLITINSCFLIYKFLGTVYTYPNFDWNKNVNELSFYEYETISQKTAERTFTNCPKNILKTQYITDDNQIIEVLGEGSSFSKLLNELQAKDKIVKVNLLLTNERNNHCIKNHKFFYLLFNKFNTIEKVFINTKLKLSSGFTEIRNPYLYGDASISRTARYFPATLIFKPFIILSALFLFLYWKNNLNLFNELKSKEIIDKFSKNFFYFGFLSAFFLTLHAIFLGVEFELKVFPKIRKAIIVIFIFSEVIAQYYLTKNLLLWKNEVIGYINPLVLKIKVIFILFLLITTLISLLMLGFSEVGSAFKNRLEWNYFSFLLFYYLLSRLLWRKSQTQVHAPEGA